ncbi:MAG: ABC transporter substrate-binding protein, partial [Micromonosporaceae bacterium]
QQPGAWQEPTSGQPWQPPVSGQPSQQPVSGQPWAAPTSGQPAPGPQPGWQPPGLPPPYGAPPPPAAGKGKGGLIAGLVAGGVVLVLLVCGGLVWALGGSESEEPTIDDKPVSAAACEKKLAFYGTLSGRYGAIGNSVRDGAKLAVEQFREKYPDCKVELVEYDTKDNRKRDAEVAKEIADDESIVGVIGPVYAIEAPESVPTLDKAGLAVISASATRDDLTDQGWKGFHRVIGPNSSQGTAIAKYLQQLQVKRMATVSDENTYFRGLAKSVADGMGSDALKNMTFNSKKRDFTEIIKYLKVSVIHAVYFSGYYEDALEFLKQLRAARLTIRVVASDAAYDSRILARASQLKHFAVSCTCAPPGELDDRFQRAFTKAYGKRPGNYAGEGYDAATVFLKGISDERATREQMLEFVKGFRGHGLTKKIQFSDTGEIRPRAPVWFYSVENKRFEYDRRID